VAGFWVTKLLLLALMVSGLAISAPLVADFASYPRMEFSRRVGTETHRD
jgi:cytochrome b subunit of formate dehydrogenase